MKVKYIQLAGRLALLMLIPCLLVKRAQSDGNASRTALQLFRSAPLWMHLDRTDGEQAQKLLDGMRDLSTYDLKELRSAVTSIDERWTKPDGFALGLNVWIFNRYYFAVPPSKLWPMKVIDGRLVIGSLCPAFGSHVPDPLQEFERFNKLYGVRKRPGYSDVPLSNVRH